MDEDSQAHAILSVAEMARADAAAIAGGIAGERLMEAAGAAVAAEVQRRYARQPVAVLCGPGNNGGDGFVAARLLQEAGWPVRVALLGRRDALKGDAAIHAGRWSGSIEPLTAALLNGTGIVVDALFGAGLTRPLAAEARDIVTKINMRGIPCVGVDVPSGVSGDTGQILGGEEAVAPQCVATVTFFRKKPAHLLLPGRLLCGDLVVADIGIPATVLDAVAPRCHENRPAFWRERYSWPQPQGHKYSRGHVLVVGGGTVTGAGRLAARAAHRIGAGLVTVAAPSVALPIYATASDALMVTKLDDARDFARQLEDVRKNVVLLGPGNGVDMITRLRVTEALAARKNCVLDADALTAFADDPQHLCRLIRRSAAQVLLTPHEGELARLFPDLAHAHEDDKLARARSAAERSGAVVVLKGYDTVIAAPDGRTTINANAPPELATAGAGDVLAGLAAGLMAQSMSAFDAACAATWLHGETATLFGPGLIADDLIATLPSSLRHLKAMMLK